MRDPRRRLLLWPLLLLVALAVVLTAGTVSAPAAHGSGTRVRAIPAVTVDAVGQPSSETAGHVGCLRPETAQLVSGSCVATEAAEVGPTAGSGGALEHLTPGEVTRIQNAANKIDQPISVVGSRASGTAGPYSDWDYVVEGANSSTIGKIRNSLPEGVRGIGDPRNLDIFRGPLNEDLPFITFKPVPR